MKMLFWFHEKIGIAFFFLNFKFQNKIHHQSMSKLAAELWQLARFSDPLSNFESRVEGSTNEIGYNSLLINIFLKK